MERTDLDVAQAMYSDIHKDVYGFRPRNVGEENWNNEAWLNTEVQSLGEELVVVMDREAEVQAENVVKFEARIKNLISSGAADRETAIRWLKESNDCDEGYLEYSFNIPYGYINKGR